VDHLAPRVGVYLADRKTPYYASPERNPEYQAGGAKGLGLTSNAVPMSRPPDGIAIAYTVELNLQRKRDIAKSGWHLGN
jgi:hypothetical protein